jgi:hypothetical protein
MTERDCFDCIHPAGDHAPFRSECYGCIEADPSAYGCRVTFYPKQLSERQERERAREIAEALDLIHRADRILERVALYKPEGVAA